MMADDGHRSAAWEDQGGILTNGSPSSELIPPSEVLGASKANDKSPSLEVDDNNDESLDYSDGDDGNTQGNYELNSDRDSAGDSVSESGSYSPNADQLQEDHSVLEEGTYRPLSAELDDNVDGPQNAGQQNNGQDDQQNQNPIVEDLIDHAEHDMCDDSESDLGSYHINSEDGADDSLEDNGSSGGEYDMSSTGEASDEDADEFSGVELLRVKYNLRQDNPVLPDTVTVLRTEDGGKVYVVGTAHFSEQSQQDVAELIQAVQPDIVMVELCKGRLSILQLDEETLLEEAKDLNMEKLRVSIKQHGLIGGVMQVLLLHMSAHLTKELGMAPGGEFRKAFQEAQKVPGCKVHLGDRPIQITLNRAMGALTIVQKLRLAWCLLTSKDPITPEDVERFKQKDLLMELLEEMMGEFPTLSQVFVSERDMYLANSLRMCAASLRYPIQDEVVLRPVVVGVVGIGHMPGIASHWEKPASLEDMQELTRVPAPSLAGRVFRWSLRASVLGMVAWGCYKCIRWTGIADDYW
ncbi:traB domain-containing protein-like [Patiria miniata]|uniref:TraB domain-containing protein n=1 Tax=Patiria miniata TaxID=46514 RepID=A0A914ABP5_PATMI|nr:traB domain-containing protein-like [Patiria miniata]XP_038061331.1 traB domain-containing protein-like [Patiria miniata]